MPATTARTRRRSFSKGDQALRLGEVHQIPLSASRSIWERLKMFLFEERLFRNPAAGNLMTEGLELLGDLLHFALPSIAS
jgi:hypothetical protein